jgi:hypothetical protein
MSYVLPLLALVGFLISGIAWTAVARALGESALRDNTPASALPKEVVDARLKYLYLRMALVWLGILGGGTLLVVSTNAPVEWRWLFGGAAVGPLIVALTILRALVRRDGS